MTSDAAGQWVFVPEVHITQGLFEARASFAGPQGQAVESAAVQFVVVNQAGQSEVPASSLKWQVGIVLVILALLGAAVIAVFVRRRRLRRDEGLHRVHHRRRRHGRDRSQSPRALADDPAPRTSRPLFMSTDQVGAISATRRTRCTRWTTRCRRSSVRSPTRPKRSTAWETAPNWELVAHRGREKPGRSFDRKKDYEGVPKRSPRARGTRRPSATTGSPSTRPATSARRRSSTKPSSRSTSRIRC